MKHGGCTAQPSLESYENRAVSYAAISTAVSLGFHNPSGTEAVWRLMNEVLSQKLRRNGHGIG